MKNELLDFCRYYQGEDENTFSLNDDRSMLWEYEKIWYNLKNSNDKQIDDFLRDYNLFDMSEFEPFDGVPITLKAVLFDLFSNWAGVRNADDFKKWYKEVYKKTGI